MNTLCLLPLFATAFFGKKKEGLLGQVVPKPPNKLFVGKLKMVASCCVKYNTVGLIGSLEAKKIIRVPSCLSHGENFFERVVSVVSPPFTFIWVNHGVFHGLNHGKLLDLEEIRFVSSVDIVTFVVPLSDLGILLECGCVDREWIAEIINLEDIFLKSTICQITTEVRNDLAHWTEKSSGVAVGKSGNTRNSSVDTEVCDYGWVVVSVDVSSTDGISLAESNAVESISKLWIGPDLGCEDIHVVVHGHKKSTESVSDLVVGARDADSILLSSGTDNSSNLFHSWVEA